MITHCFEPDVLLPVPAHGIDKLYALQPGPRKLMLVVLQDALTNALGQHGHDGRRKRAIRKREARLKDQAWLASRRRSWLFDYEMICTFLKLHPDYLRRNVAIMALLLWLSNSQKRQKSRRLVAA